MRQIATFNILNHFENKKKDMNDKRVYILSLFIIWGSVILIAYGTHLKTISPDLEAYQLSVINEIADKSPNVDMGEVLSRHYNGIS